MAGYGCQRAIPEPIGWYPGGYRVQGTGGKLFVGCFSDANPDPWSNPRRVSEAELRALLSEDRGWRVVELKEAWYERPSERSASAGGAWTMAWWCVAEAV